MLHGNLKVGLIGCGRIAQYVHLRVLSQVNGARVVALAEADETRLADAAAMVPSAQTFRDYRDLLKCDGIDAVVICLPTGMHAESAVAAFGAGKHVYLEKPIATNRADAEAVMDAWRASGRVGQIGFKTERDGTIALDEAKLDAALSTNYGAVKSLFINQTTISGVAQRINQAVDALDDVESGSFSIRKAALSDRIADLSDEIGRKEDALSKYEERLRAQYAALDGLLRRLQGQTSFLSGQTSL